ncbi:MAG: HD domain-containing protein, partial [Chloroflexi bacterium]|nr:HD domain-containing protein [Chloroflexota bacterium]
DAMTRHVVVGEVLLNELPQLKDVVDAVSCHHERYDGSGYPRGLRGEEIPLVGRIIAIADAHSAMTLDRPYRKAISGEQVMAELAEGSGSQFDPELLTLFVELLKEEASHPKAA